IARPRQDSPLVIEFALRSDLLPHRDGANGFEFRHQGEAVLRYGDLRATDTAGNPLPVGAEVRAGVLRLTLDDAGAVYPIHLQAHITGLSTSPDWSTQGNQQSAALGFSVATAGDVNGDGYADVIVGAPQYDSGQDEGGMVWVYYGSAAGLSSTAAWSAQVNQGEAKFGFSVATAGDVNGDGYSDVIVGAPHYDDGEDNEGAVWVYHGSGSGLSSTANWSAQVNQEWANLGDSVATAGDVNGDGYSDVIVGAPYYDVAANGDDRGTALVWYGGSGGLEDPGDPSWFEFGNSDNENYGDSVATAGDVNGDGYADVIVGSPGYSFLFNDGGRAQVYHGSSTGLSASNDWEVYGPQYALLGRSVSTAGDVNGDGYADVIVGVPAYTHDESGEGQARVYHGSSTGLSSTEAWSVESNQAFAEFGDSVATAGDVNGDGYADVLIGSYLYADGQQEEGKAWVYWGSSGGLASTAGWTAESDSAYANFGSSVATAGDVNGDGYSDIIVGAPGYTYDQSNEGMAFAFYGGPDNLSPSPGWTYESDYDNKNLGQAVATAGDVNGDGYADILVGAPAYDSGQTDEGAVFAWYGDAGGFGWGGPDWSAYGEQDNAQLGYAVSTAGDVNGDGYSDVIAGAPYYDNGQSDEGAAFLWLGSSGGLGGVGTPGNADWFAESNQADAHLGYDVAAAGDVNNDGYADVAIGAPHYDNGQTNEGVVFVWHGDSAGLGANGTPNNADWHAESDSDSLTLGLSVDTAGDVNGDGYSDLIAGANGVASAWYGSSGGLSSSADWAASDSGLFGWSVATAGDVDGNGYSDVIVGAPFYDGSGTADGAAWAYCGGSGGLDNSPCWGDYGGSGYNNAWFGWDVGTAGDVNGDGYADIIVGAPGWSNPTTAEGQARVYYGSSWGPVSFNGGDWTVESNATTANLGYAVSTAGDFNGDGYADVLIGLPQYSNGQSSEGRVELYWGNGRMGIAAHPRQLRTDGTTPIAPLGLSDSQLGFNSGATARSATGRGQVRLCLEVKPLGTAFDGSGLACSVAQDSGIGGVWIPRDVTGLSAGTRYHWRVRAKYDPVTNPFDPPYGRWLHMPWNGWNEADLRTAGSGSSGNNPPYTPSNPSPADGATGVSLNTSLSWTGGDPDSGDTVTYDVYLGTSDPPPQVATGLSATTYKPSSNLSPNQTYYWMITAYDNHGASADGPVWSFTTGTTTLAHKVYLPLVVRKR
ncbi:MAG TPA: hypothetical protein ENJ31_02140, partial [Anaerolineae bacterium]|nr:hypothetical protein [Anaerolineae bacterium]